MHFLVIRAGQKVDSVDLCVGQLFSGQALDVAFKIICVVGAIVPWLLRRSLLLGQKLSLALICVFLVIDCFCAAILKETNFGQ